ncbi:MAG TPA: ABC transporter permease [Rubrobacteraceae bacterium]|nr:ABC transporter permease [Rubrobacteraceae bacterium]
MKRRGKIGSLREASGARVALRAALPIGLLAVWYFLTLGREDDPRVATPAGVVRAFGELWASGDLLIGTSVSLQHVIFSFVIAAVSGTAVGMLMGYFRAADQWLGPLVHSLRPIAPYAWIPMAILWLGIGDAAAMFVITYAAFFPMIVSVMAGVHSIDRNLIDAARVLGASQWMTLRRVVFPGALPGITVGLRLALGMAWIAVVAAELATGNAGGRSATGGLGQMMFIFYAYEINLNYIVVCIIVVALMALISDRIMQKLHRRLAPWQADER